MQDETQAVPELSGGPRQMEDGFYTYKCPFEKKWVILEIKNGFALQTGVEDMYDPAKLPGEWGVRILVPRYDA
jgi:hypothetical protein